jgi:phage terminase small subunit
MSELTQKQRMFADEYVLTGNASQSYQKIYNCGIKEAEASSSRLLSNVKVTEYIITVNQKIKNDKIADMQEIKEFWTDIKRDKTQETKDRLKASEFIAKTNAAFIENRNISGSLLVNIIDDLDDLEDDDEDED